MKPRTVIAAILGALLLFGGGALFGSWLSSEEEPTAHPRAKAKVGKRRKLKKRTRPPKGEVPAERPPNILFIVWDTVRADRMSLYGHERPTTPYLDRFARQARVFDNAISPGMWTIPSHASMFTGLPAPTHGAHARWRWLDHHHVTLAEHLSANGYSTYVYTANPNVGGLSNLLQGFDVKRHSWDEDSQRTKMDAKRKLIRTDRSTEISPRFDGARADVAWGQSTYKEAALAANDDLTRWLSKRPGKERPWFAFLNLMEAHTPRIPAMESRQVLLDEAMIELGLQTELSLWNEVSAILGEHTFTEAEVQAIRGVYDATILELDQAFAEMMGRLEAKGVLDDTIVVLTSDHGESLGEHGLWEHRYAVYQTLVHVPLLVRYPERLTPARVAQPVSTASIYPTILDLAGLPPPSGVTLPRSLTRAPNQPVYTTLMDPYTSKLKPFLKAYPDVDLSRVLRTFDAMVDGELKIIHSSDGAHELYDLGSDPGETLNLFGRHPRSTELLEGVQRWARNVPKSDPAKRTAADKRKGRGYIEESRTMSAMLEQLGYVVDDEEDP